MAVAVPFPSTLPPGYELLGDEPAFDPELHLALEDPVETLSLADLGYSEDEIHGKATRFAVSAPFRILSDEGAAVMLATARRLKAHRKPAGERIENVVRGGCYRSVWLRDLCLSAEVNDHLAKIYDVDIAPHPMAMHLGHMNFEPTKLETAIDKWHHDTLPLDFVMMVTDPATVDGGRFEYFAGTKAEAESLRAAGELPPPERVVAPEFPGPGWAIALHGDMVVHRAGPMHALGERISMVNGYVALDTSLDGQNRTQDLLNVDPPEVVSAEWARYAAWRTRGRLAALAESINFETGPDAVAAGLEAAVEDVQRAIAGLRGLSDPSSAQAIHHYEQR